METKPHSSRLKWFSVALITLGALFVLILAFGKLSKPLDHPPLTSQAIRLRAFAPGLDLQISPLVTYVQGTDGLSPGPFHLRTDENGFVISAVQNKDPDFSIYFLGGSTTECLYVNEAARFASRTAENLQSLTGKKINTYNAGVSGNHTLHAIDILIHRILPRRPNMAVLMENINDLAILLHKGTYWNDSPTRSLIVSDKVYDKHDDEFETERNKKILLKKDQWVQDFKANLKLFIEVCRLHGITPVLMTQASRFKENPDPLILSLTRPWTSSSLSYSQFRDLFDTFNESIRQVALNQHVMLIDLARQIPQDKRYIYDTVHYNDAGSIFAASIIAGNLKTILVR